MNFKRIVTSLILSTIIFLGAGCTPEQVELFNKLTPIEQQAVINHVNNAQSTSESMDCYTAVDKYFTGDKARMKKIVKRESGNNPAAKNKNSTASGCVQALRMHDWRYAEVGCSASQKFQAACNVKVADHLYREQGWRPWKLTDY